MRIQYLTEYFHTPREGGLMRTWEVSKFLAEKGHAISVVVPAAHHMTGRLPDGFGRHIWRVSREGDVRVTRVWTATGFRGGYLQRLLYYLTTPIFTLLAATRERPDVLMASSPPFFLAPLALVYCRLRRIPFVLEIRDMWLEFAVAKGMVPRPLVGMLHGLQSWVFRHADRIVAVTPGIQEIALRQLGPRGAETVCLVMNGYEEDVFRDADPCRTDQIRQEWGLHDKFVVIYTGTMGLARDCMTFVRAAALLKDEPDILFAFVGEGESKSEMVTFAADNRLENCLFVPMQPRADMPAWLAASAVGLNSIRAGEALESSLSNKIFDYLGAGIPCVFSGGGDTSDFLESSGGGLVVPAEDAAAMADAVRSLHRDPAMRERMGQAGQRYVLQNFARTQLLIPLEALLAEVAERNRSNRRAGPPSKPEAG